MTAAKYLVLIAVLAAGLTSMANAKEIALKADQGVSIQIVEVGDLDSTVTVGRLNVITAQLRGSTGLQSGYINGVIEDKWAIRNLQLFTEDEYPYPQISADFDLATIPDLAVNEMSVEMVYSSEPFTVKPLAVPAVQIPLERTTQPLSLKVEGAFSIATPRTTNFSELVFGDTGNNLKKIQLDHPNIETELIVSPFATIANSLQFLANTTELVLPHPHRAGEQGDGSIVGELMSASSGNLSTEGFLRSKLNYLSTWNLSDVIETRHWGRGGDKNFTETSYKATASNFLDFSPATSTGQGLTIGFDPMIEAVRNGEDCEVFYRGYQGWLEAIDVVGAGFVQGEPWILGNSDRDLKNNKAGAGKEGFEYVYLSDPDADGLLNLDGGDREIIFMMCQRYIPKVPLPSGVLFPPTGTTFEEPAAALAITNTSDPAGHSCCVTPPPSSIGMSVTPTGLRFSGGAGWLPFDAVLNENGTFAASNTATVAGFSNIKNSITGTYFKDGVSAKITLGTDGGLPSAQPISYDVTITGKDGSWSWFTVPPALPVPALRINGARGAVAVTTGERIAFSGSLTAGGVVDASDVDWWMVAQLGSEPVYASFTTSTGTWEYGLAPLFQSPAADVPNTIFHAFPDGLPQGEYTFYFGVDMNPNGQIDLDTLQYDAINLSVGPP